MTVPEQTAPAARQRSTRRWWVLGVLGVLAGTAVAVWFGLSATVGRVHWIDTGHLIVSEREVQVRFDLRRDPERAVECELQALDSSHARVGTTTVRIEPAATSPTRHIETVRTTSPAVTGYVDRCWYVGE